MVSNITHLASLTTSDSIWQLASEKCLFTAFSRGTDMLSQKLPHRTCKQKADHGAPIGAISWHVREILTVIKTVPGTDLLQISSFRMFENYKHPACCWRCRCLKWNRSLSLKSAVRLSVVRFWSEGIEHDIWWVDPTSLHMRNVCQGLQGQAANKKHCHITIS